MADDLEALKKAWAQRLAEDRSIAQELLGADPDPAVVSRALVLLSKSLKAIEDSLPPLTPEQRRAKRERAKFDAAFSEPDASIKKSAGDDGTKWPSDLSTPVLRDRALAKNGIRRRR